MLDLILLPDDYAVCRLDPGTPLPAGLQPGTTVPGQPAGLVSVTWTADEISLICAAARAPSDGVVNAPWRCLQVEGPVDLALTGVLASLVNPLAEARVNVFAFSTHDTDYVLVPSVRLAEALAALDGAGHRVRS